MSKVHLVAGPNNSGKSNILRFAYETLGAFADGRRGQPTLPDGINRPLAAEYGGQFRVSLGIRVSHETLEQLFPEDYLRADGRIPESLIALFNSPAFVREGSELSWVDFEVSVQGLNPSLEQCRSAESYYAAPPAGTFRLNLRTLASTQQIGARNFRDDLSALHAIVNKLNLPDSLRAVEMIGGFRQVVEGTETASHSGNGLIIRLAELQNPANNDQEKLQQFEDINKFVQNVLEDDSARIRIPYTHDEILVSSRGRTLPLDNLGTGVHEVIILAAAATVVSNSLVCIEEPEVHLHPVLQRRLIRYLRDHTTNRYLIATHSAHLLDTSLASISHVAIGENGTQIAPAITPTELFRISTELGYKASDIVQSNCVIWVEGPSDRVYIRHWISLLDPALIEGVDYSIMFYGGSLLNHLTSDDPEISEFISLRRLNRNMAIIIDSDKSSAQKPLNKTKKRIIEELEDDGHSHTWVTDGYTIENYVPPEILKSAIERKYPRVTFTWDGGKFTNPLRKDNHSGSPEELAKAAVAVEVTAELLDIDSWSHDLRKKVQKLISFIRASNHLDR